MTEAAAGDWVRLLRAAQAGDDAAFARLLERLYVRITARMVRESSIRAQLAGATAEDVAAIAIQHVADAITTCRAGTDAEVLAWAYQIAANVAADQFRSRAARLFLLCVTSAREDLPSLSEEALWDEALPVDGDERALIQAVFDAYGGLPDSAAELIWHRLTGQPSWADTAAAFGTTEDGARRRFQRALDRLRRAVGRIIGAMPPDDREAARRALARRQGPPRRHSDP